MTTPDLRLVPKTPEQTAAWLPVAMTAYRQARQRAGENAEQAAEASRMSESQFFPEGRLIDGHFLFSVEADGEDAGWLWLGPMKDVSTWYVWDVAVHEAFRGRGIGRATMALAEEFARSQGATMMQLNVFAYNEPAIGLYGSMGYTVTSMHMQKPLERLGSGTGTPHG
jgi:ribosomal protein S18 acetylase RimI-like enzyme